MELVGTGPSGLEQIYDAEWVRRFMHPIEAMFANDDVQAVVIRRTGGDYLYERSRRKEPTTGALYTPAAGSTGPLSRSQPEGTECAPSVTNPDGPCSSDS